MKLLKKPFAYATIFGMLLTGGFTYSMLRAPLKTSQKTYKMR